MDLGRVNQRTAQRVAAGGSRGQRVRSSRFDRWGREIGLRNPAGKVYEPCPMCEKRAMTRTRVADGIEWTCENCGYRDHSERGALV